MRHQRPMLFALVSACALCALPARADSLFWTGAADTNWNTTSVNWVDTNSTPATFSAGDDVTFDDRVGVDKTITVDASGVQPDHVTFDNDLVNYTLQGGAISASGTLIKEKGASLVLTSNLTNNVFDRVIVKSGTISTRVDGARPLGEGKILLKGTLHAYGSTGSLVGSEDQILVLPGGSLVFDDNQGWDTGSTHYDGIHADGRWGDNALIRLRSGAVSILCGNVERGSTTLAHENVGTIEFNGGSRTICGGYRPGATAIVADNLVRLKRGHLILSGIDPSNADWEVRKRVCVDNGATLLDSESMAPPWIGLNWGGFVTYDSTVNDIGRSGAFGFPGQPQTEVGFTGINYDGTDVTGYAGQVTSNIINQSVSATLNSDTTIHALHDAAGLAIADGKTLTITSGGLIISGKNHALGNAGGIVDFGTAEGVIWAVNPGGGFWNSSSFAIYPNLTGANGLTLYHDGYPTTYPSAKLWGNNSGLSGPIIINGGLVDIYNENGLPSGQDLHVAGRAILDLNDLKTPFTVADLSGGGTILDNVGTTDITATGTVRPGDDCPGKLTLQNVNLTFGPGSDIEITVFGPDGEAGIDFAQVDASGTVSNINSATVTLTAPDWVDPKPFVRQELLILKCSNNLSGDRCKRVYIPAKWKKVTTARTIGVDGGVKLIFGVSGTVLTVL